LTLPGLNVNNNNKIEQNAISALVSFTLFVRCTTVNYHELFLVRNFLEFWRRNTQLVRVAAPVNGQNGNAGRYRLYRMIDCYNKSSQLLILLYSTQKYLHAIGLNRVT